VVVDVEALDPQRLLHELHRSRAVVELLDQRQRDRQAGQGADQGQPAHCLDLVLAAQGQQEGAECDRHPD